MVNIVLKVVERLDVTANLSSDGLMIADQLIVCIASEVSTSHEVDELTERETTQVIRGHDAIEHWVSILEAHHSTTCEDDLHLRILVVDKLQLLTPVRVLEDLIDQQRTSALLLESSDELTQRVSVEVEVVHVDVETAMVVRTILLKCILEQESRLSHASAALDANKAIPPIDFINQLTAYR